MDVMDKKLKQYYIEVLKYIKYDISDLIDDLETDDLTFDEYESLMLKLISTLLGRLAVID